MLVDSGSRREFETGATRDMGENGSKGRCDLLPFFVISAYYEYLRTERYKDECEFYSEYDCEPVSFIFDKLDKFGCTEDSLYILQIIDTFIRKDLCVDPQTAFLEVAFHFEEGAKKYSERNWELGIPTHCFVDSAVRHYLKYLRGDKDEPHHRAFLWNLLCLIWTMNYRPMLCDFPKSRESSSYDSYITFEDCKNIENKELN